MIEIRKNEDGSLDEIVGRNCRVQLEQMSNQEWFLCIESGTDRVDVRLGTKRAHVKAFGERYAGDKLADEFPTVRG